MGFFDSIGDMISGASEWFGRNQKTIEGVANAGKNIFSAISQNNARQEARGGIADVLERQFLADIANRNAARDYAIANQGAGGGGGIRSAYSAAALAKQEKDRQRAAKKALEVQKKAAEQMMQMYQPFIDAGKTLVPKQMQNYEGFLDTTGMLNQYLSSAAMQNFASPPKAAHEIVLPKSAYAVAAPQATRSAMSLEEILKNGLPK